MSTPLKITGYFAGSLFSAQELCGNRSLCEAINDASGGLVQLDLPQDMSTQETGDGRGVRSTDYLGMVRRDVVIANMNGPELDSGTVAEYMVASMLGMPRVQLRTDFRNVGDVPTDFPPGVTVRKTAAVPYNLMLGSDESATVLVNSMELYKAAGGVPELLRGIGVAAINGIRLALGTTMTAAPEEYAGWQKSLVDYLNLDASAVEQILRSKLDRHRSADYRAARDALLAFAP